MVAIAEACNTRPVAAPLRAADAALFVIFVPFWVVITCRAAIGLGTLIGGWRIVRTVGSKITRLTPVQGCCASAGGAIMLFAATYLGIPVSTTHTVPVRSFGSERREKYPPFAGTSPPTLSSLGSSHCQPQASRPRYATSWLGSLGSGSLRAKENRFSL